MLHPRQHDCTNSEGYQNPAICEGLFFQDVDPLILMHHRTDGPEMKIPGNVK